MSSYIAMSCEFVSHSGCKVLCQSMINRCAASFETSAAIDPIVCLVLMKITSSTSAAVIDGHLLNCHQSKLNRYPVVSPVKTRNRS